MIMFSEEQLILIRESFNEALHHDEQESVTTILVRANNSRFLIMILCLVPDTVKKSFRPIFVNILMNFKEAFKWT